MIYVVDASVWVSRLVPQDVYHPHSRRWLETQVARGARMILPIWLLAEVAGAIARRTGEPAMGLRSMDLLLRFPGVQWVIIDFSLGLEMARWSANLRLKGCRCGVCGHCFPPEDPPGDMGSGTDGAGKRAYLRDDS